MINLVLRNIKSLISSEKISAILILLCVFFSSIIIHFSYGLYQNYHVILKNETPNSSSLFIEIVDETAINKRQLLSCLLSLPPEVNDEVQMYMLNPDVTVTYDGLNNEQQNSVVECRFAISNGDITNSLLFENNISNNGLLRGKYYTLEQQQRGDLVSLTSEIVSEKGVESIIVQGKKYEIIGYSLAVSVDIPIQSLEDDTLFTGSIIFLFGENDGRVMTRAQYDIIKEHFLSYFGNAVSIPELDIPDENNAYLYRTILVISFLIAIIAAANYSQIYKYILEKRQRKIAIMRLCGCTRFYACLLFYFEMLFFLIPTYLISVLFFIYVILPSISQYYPYMTDAFSAEIYLVLFIIYLLASILSFFAMLITNIKKRNVYR